MNNSRRQFLKVAGISAFALGSGVAGSLLASGAGAATVKGSYERNTKGLKAGRWAMVIDTRKFRTDADFAAVINACHKTHNVPNIPGDQNIKWMWTDLYDNVFTDDQNSMLPQKMVKGKYLLLCNHCTNPPCVRVCPTQATFKMADGTVAMDYHRCIGCRFCMAGCPYGARSFNYMDPRKHLENPYPNPAYPTRMAGVVEKCTFCTERLAVGLMPACVEASNGAILFGDLNDPHSNVRKALEENYNIRRKPTLGTQPGVYYLV
ncbi:MAG: 4Fe-4S dicluster domain-containing protein [Desulfovibrionaceae bacterium]